MAASMPTRETTYRSSFTTGDRSSLADVGAGSLDSPTVGKAKRRVVHGLSLVATDRRPDSPEGQETPQRKQAGQALIPLQGLVMYGPNGKSGRRDGEYDASREGGQFGERPSGRGGSEQLGWRVERRCLASALACVNGML